MNKLDKMQNPIRILEYRILHRVNLLDEHSYKAEGLDHKGNWINICGTYNWIYAEDVWFPELRLAEFIIDCDIKDTELNIKKNTFKTQEIIKYEKV